MYMCVDGMRRFRTSEWRMQNRRRSIWLKENAVCERFYDKNTKFKLMNGVAAGRWQKFAKQTALEWDLLNCK